jgi:hypothetical protein
MKLIIETAIEITIKYFMEDFFRYFLKLIINTDKYISKISIPVLLPVSINADTENTNTNAEMIAP